MAYFRGTTHIRISITHEEYDTLMFALGCATGCAKDPAEQRAYMRLVNSLNEGNPNFTPYEVPEGE